MGVYVPRMKMPERCLLCPFENMMTCTCDPDERFANTKKRQRPEWCPLVEIQGSAIILEDSAWTSDVMTSSSKEVQLGDR